MEPQAVETLIRAGMPDAQVSVTGDGSHFEALVVSTEFQGKSLLTRQRLVIATVKDRIQSGELHALSIKTYTPDERASDPA